MADILLVADDAAMLQILQKVLAKAEYRVTTVTSATEARARCAAGAFDLVVTDLGLEGEAALVRLVHDFAARDAGLPVILVTARATIPSALAALKEGAFDYVVKPIKMAEFLASVQHALEYRRLKKGLERGQVMYLQHPRYPELIAECPGMRHLCAQIPTLGAHRGPLLIRGEWGTGRKTLARLIHAAVGGTAAHFRVISCLGYPESITDVILYGGRRHDQQTHEQVLAALQAARAGDMLCIEDAQALPLDTVDAIARALDGLAPREKIGRRPTLPFRLVVLAGGRRESPPPGQVSLQNWEELLGTSGIEIPPLRDRREDILPLACYFLSQTWPPGTIAPEFEKTLQLYLEAYTWPGNLIELRDAMHQMSTLTPRAALSPDDLPPIIQASVGILAAKTAAEQRLESYRGRALRAFLDEKMKEAATRLKALQNEKRPPA